MPQDFASRDHTPHRGRFRVFAILSAWNPPGTEEEPP